MGMRRIGKMDQPIHCRSRYQRDWSMGHFRAATDAQYWECSVQRSSHLSDRFHGPRTLGTCPKSCARSGKNHWIWHVHSSAKSQMSLKSWSLCQEVGLHTLHWPHWTKTNRCARTQKADLRDLACIWNSWGHFQYKDRAWMSTQDRLKAKSLVGQYQDLYVTLPWWSKACLTRHTDHSSSSIYRLHPYLQNQHL